MIGRVDLQSAIGTRFDLARSTNYSLKSIDSMFREMFEVNGVSSDGKVAIKELATLYLDAQNDITFDNIDEDHDALANGKQSSNYKVGVEGSSGGPIDIGEISAPATKAVNSPTKEMVPISRKGNDKKRRIKDGLDKIQSDLGPVWQTPLEDRKAKKPKVCYEV